MRRSGRTRAFTLVEAIAIVIVLSLAVPATVGMLYDATRQRVQTRQNLEAERFASALLETVLADAYSPDAGLGLDAVTDPAYEQLIASRLGGLVEFSSQRGFTYRIAVSGPVGIDANPASGSEYRYVTATVEWMPAGSTTRSSLSAGVLVTGLPRAGGSVFGPPPAGYQVYQTINADASWNWKRLGWEAVEQTTALRSGRRSRRLRFNMQYPGDATTSQLGLTVKSQGIESGTEEADEKKMDKKGGEREKGKKEEQEKKEKKGKKKGKKHAGRGKLTLDFKVSVYDTDTRRWRKQDLHIRASGDQWQTAWIDVGNVSGTGYVVIDWKNAKRLQHEGLTVAGIQMAGRQ